MEKVYEKIHNAIFFQKNDKEIEKSVQLRNQQEMEERDKVLKKCQDQLIDDENKLSDYQKTLIVDFMKINLTVLEKDQFDKIHRQHLRQNMFVNSITLATGFTCFAITAKYKYQYRMLVTFGVMYNINLIGMKDTIQNIRNFNDSMVQNYKNEFIKMNFEKSI